MVKLERNINSETKLTMVSPVEVILDIKVFLAFHGYM